MAHDYPPQPWTDGQVHVIDGVELTYIAAHQQWVISDGSTLTQAVYDYIDNKIRTKVVTIEGADLVAGYYEILEFGNFELSGVTAYQVGGTNVTWNVQYNDSGADLEADTGSTDAWTTDRVTISTVSESESLPDNAQSGVSNFLAFRVVSVLGGPTKFVAVIQYHDV